VLPIPRAPRSLRIRPTPFGDPRSQARLLCRIVAEPFTECNAGRRFFSPFINSRPFLAQVARPDTIEQDSDIIVCAGLAVDAVSSPHLCGVAQRLLSCSFLGIPLSERFPDIANDFLLIADEDHVPSRINQRWGFAPTGNPL
jgi:hypothetical protein